MPRGRPKLPDTPSNAERQRRVRVARAAKVERLEQIEAAARLFVDDPNMDNLNAMIAALEQQAP